MPFIQVLSKSRVCHLRAIIKDFFATPGNRQPDYVGRCRWRCPGVDALQKPRDMNSFYIFMQKYVA